MGRAVACLGDQDDDGYADLLVGASSNDVSVENDGAAWLFYGPIAGSLTRFDAEAGWFGSGANAFAGVGVAAADDLNGDGYGRRGHGSDGRRQRLRRARDGPTEGFLPTAGVPTSRPVVVCSCLAVARSSRWSHALGHLDSSHPAGGKGRHVPSTEPP